MTNYNSLKFTLFRSILCNTFLYNVRYKSLLNRFLWDLKMMKFVFFILRVIWLSVSHSWTRANSEFTVASSSCISFPEQNIFMSSANKIVDNLVVALIRSFIYIKNSKGPRTDPWGTRPTSNQSLRRNYLIVFHYLLSTREVIFYPCMTTPTYTIEIKFT